MKKLGALLCIILVAISLSACRTFRDDSTQNYSQSNPFTATVFLQVKNLPDSSNMADELVIWQGAVNMHNATIPDDQPKITAVEPIGAEDNGTYAVALTIQNVPDSTMRKQVSPFKIIYTQTVFNPIVLLPDSAVFGYIVGYSAERRHSAASTTQIVTTDNGEYIYLWTTPETIQFVDVYPNRPLYYLFVVLGATAFGVVVYFVSRYYDCKKQKKPL